MCSDRTWKFCTPRDTSLRRNAGNQRSIRGKGSESELMMQLTFSCRRNSACVICRASLSRCSRMCPFGLSGQFVSCRYPLPCICPCGSCSNVSKNAYLCVGQFFLHTSCSQPCSCPSPQQDDKIAPPSSYPSYIQRPQNSRNQLLTTHPRHPSFLQPQSTAMREPCLAARPSPSCTTCQVHTLQVQIAPCASRGLSNRGSSLA